LEAPREEEEAWCGALKRAGGEVSGAVGGVSEVHGVRAKLTAATACPEDGWRRLASLGCSAADEEAMVGGVAAVFGPVAQGRLRGGGDRDSEAHGDSTALGAQSVVDGSTVAGC
jgi:hypothetical protein